MIRRAAQIGFWATLAGVAIILGSCMGAAVKLTMDP